MADLSRAPVSQVESFPLAPDTASAVRAFLASSARLDSIRAAEAALLATELVANALSHGGAEEIEVSVETKPPSLRVTVSHVAPDPLQEVEPGFGFTLLDGLARNWGHLHRDGRLQVWFEVRAPGSARGAEALSDEELIAGLDEEPLYSDELVRRHHRLALAIAGRYRGKGIADDDLEQVAMMGLLKAIRRYDPDKGDLESYAAVTASGELKRLLRDRAWSVRVPRSLQERAMEVGRVSARLSQVLGRSPRLSELAGELGLTEEEVAEALSARHAYTSASLESRDESTGLTLGDHLAQIDEGLAGVEHRGIVDQALLGLPERERLILFLRFYRGMTQSEIAEEVGVSQMHVSRLLSRSLDHLRRRLSGE